MAAGRSERRAATASVDKEERTETMKTSPCVISVADHAGWAYALCVAAPSGIPAVVERRRLTLIDAGLPTMPYHHESLGLPVDEADRLIARVRQSIASCAL